MQIYYFSRTGRSKEIAEQIALRYHTIARKIDDHKNWDGKVNYMKAGAMALSGKTIPVDYIEPDADDKIVVVFPLWAGTMPPGVKTFVENYDSELEHLEDKYGMPDGRLLLAYYDKQLAGCIGLRKIDEENCEMKRLYVRAEFRGKKIGEYLAEEIIKIAREIGYSYMLLDTLPFLQSAIKLYERLGFYLIESYNNSPMDTSIYMQLDL